MFVWVLVLELTGIDGALVKEYSTEKECRTEMKYISEHYQENKLDLQKVYCIKQKEDSGV
jgi:hypothetical protein